MSEQTALELPRGQVAERRVQAFLVVDLFEKHAEARPGVGEVAIFGTVSLLVLQGFQVAKRESAHHVVK